MAISEVNNYQLSWIVARNAATADAFLTFAENLPTLSATAPSDTQIVFSGSPLGLQLSGSPSAVRADFDSLVDKRFLTATITATYPLSSSSRLTVAFNFPLLQLTASIPNVQSTQAEELFTDIRERFPAGRGPQQTELEARAMKLARLLQEAQDLISAADSVRLRQDEVEQLLAEVQTAAETAETRLGKIATHASTAEEQRELVESDRQDVARELAAIKILREEIVAARDSVGESKTNVDALEKSITDFNDEIEAGEERLKALHSSANAIVKQYSEQTAVIVNENVALEKQIREQLLKAAGGTLFGAFDERRRQVTKSKYVWATAAVASFLLQAAAVVYLAYEARDTATRMVQKGGSQWLLYSNPLFILKATAAIPIIALIVFCVRQYAHERSVEETYAFKSALSFSLVPYLDLVSKLIGDEQAAPHAEFTIRTIGQIFEERIGQSVDSVGSGASVSKELIEKVTKLVEAVNKLKP